MTTEYKCPICQKSLNHYSITQRQQHCNRCSDKKEKESSPAAKSGLCVLFFLESILVMRLRWQPAFLNFPISSLKSLQRKTTHPKQKSESKNYYQEKRRYKSSSQETRKFASVFAIWVQTECHEWVQFAPLWWSWSNIKRPNQTKKSEKQAISYSPLAYEVLSMWKRSLCSRMASLFFSYALVCQVKRIRWTPNQLVHPILVCSSTIWWSLL